MKAIILDSLPAQALEELDELYHSTKLARLRTRAQTILLSAEQRLKAARIAELVRDNERTVQRWLQRYQAEGVKGLYDAPRSGKPGKVTQAYKDKLLESVRLELLPLTVLALRSSLLSFPLPYPVAASDA